MGTLVNQAFVTLRLTALRRLAQPLVVGVASCAVLVAGLLASPGASAQPSSCSGVEIYGPVKGQTTARVYDLTETPIGELRKQATPLRPLGCEGELLVIPWLNADGVAVVKRRDVQTNVKAEPPVCPDAVIASNQSQYDRSSQGAGGGLICVKKKK
jgi:hypothetical protein